MRILSNGDLMNRKGGSVNVRHLPHIVPRLLSVFDLFKFISLTHIIQLLEYPIPPPPPRQKNACAIDLGNRESYHISADVKTTRKK